MEYIIYYSVGSILFLLITIISYMTKKGLPDKKNRIYRFMLFMALLAVVSDALSAYFQTIAMSFPIGVLYFTNGLLIVAMHSCLIAFIFYLFIFINTKLSLIKDLIISIPYIILIIFTLISPFTRFGIFYIDSEHIYQLGKTHALLYVNTIFYMLLAVYIIFIKGKIIRFITKLSLTCSIFLVLGLTIFQMLNPTYLLTASATVLGITVMYYVVQLLSQYLDTSTNTYNRVAFSQLLENVDNRKKPLWACLISIYSLDDVSLLQNNHIDDEIITMVGKNLNNLFVGCHVCHLYYTNYVVLSSKPLLENECLKKINKISTSPIIDNIQVQYKIGITIVNTKALETPAELINLIDYVIFHELYMNPKLTIFYETTILKYQNQLDLNVNFKKYLVSGLLKQQIKEIYTIDQELHGCQVIPWVDVSYEVSIEDLIDAARSNNCITLMIKTLIMDLKNQMDKLDKYKYISIKLPQSFILNNEVM